MSAFACKSVCVPLLCLVTIGVSDPLELKFVSCNVDACDPNGGPLQEQ